MRIRLPFRKPKPAPSETSAGSTAERARRVSNALGKIQKTNRRNRRSGSTGYGTNDIPYDGGGAYGP
ncbi:hypothetical protein [Nocardia sp. NPDC052566]|uniref:hypothetical protein n=1 Tax=Nocardia sp. NPDC052566 TaxID=3364330 RepID=UPI0037C752E5